MFYKVKKVSPLSGLSLLVEFENNTRKQYDVEPLVHKWKVFGDLTNIAGLFERVKVDIGGYGVSWNDDIDLSCNELWNNGKTVS